MPESAAQSQRACMTVFEDCLQWSQMSWNRICRHRKFFLNGLVSWHDLHRKFRTLFGMGSPQINFQLPLSSVACVSGKIEALFLTRKDEPDLTVYFPDEVYGQIYLSSMGIRPKGMLVMRFTSCGLNNPLSGLISHCMETGCMSSDTFMCSKPVTASD